MLIHFMKWIANLISFSTIMSILAIIISYLSYRNSLAQKQNALHEQREVFYKLVRNVILIRLEKHFYKVEGYRVVHDKSICVVKLRPMEIYVDNRKIETIEELYIQSKRLFLCTLCRYIKSLSKGKYSKIDYLALNNSEYHNWLYQRFEKYLTVN